MQNDLTKPESASVDSKLGHLFARIDCTGVLRYVDTNVQFSL